MNANEIVEVVIEIPKGCRNKYEFDKERKVFKLDRMLFSSMHYPSDYGFIPETLAEDGDPLDVLVLLGEPTFHRALFRRLQRAREKEDRGGRVGGRPGCPPCHRRGPGPVSRGETLARQKKGPAPRTGVGGYGPSSSSEPFSLLLGRPACSRSCSARSSEP